jgi:hypothetical protein
MCTKAYGKKNAFTAGLCLLLGALMFSACDTNSGGDTPSIIGEWKYNFTTGSGYERYSITEGSLTKYEDWGTGSGESAAFSGSIEYIDEFTSDAGVIIIKYTLGKEKQWMDWSDIDNPTPVARTGDYYGIYYRDLTNESVTLADTSDMAHSSGSGPTETQSLEAAKAKFTKNNVTNLVNWSLVQPQIRQ